MDGVVAGVRSSQTPLHVKLVRLHRADVSTQRGECRQRRDDQKKCEPQEVNSRSAYPFILPAHQSAPVTYRNVDSFDLPFRPAVASRWFYWMYLIASSPDVCLPSSWAQFRPVHGNGVCLTVKQERWRELCEMAVVQDPQPETNFLFFSSYVLFLISR